MSDTPGDREFLRRLKAAPKKSAALAAALIMAAVGLTLLLPQVFRTETPAPTCAVPPVQTDHGSTAGTGTSFRLPDPDVSLTLIVPGNVSERVMRTASQAVMIRAASPETGEVGFGTGFLAAPDLIVSAVHIFSRTGAPAGTEVITVNCDGLVLPATVRGRIDLRDLIALDAPGCGGETVHIRSRATNVRDARYFVSGYAFDDQIAHAERFFRPTTPRDGGDICAEMAEKLGLRPLSIAPDPSQSYDAYDHALRPGNSGAPVIDEDGNVVGMFVIWDLTDDISCYVPGAEIRAFLDTLK